MDNSQVQHRLLVYLKTLHSYQGATRFYDVRKIGNISYLNFQR